jgi:uncharacterized protein DUF4352
MTKLAQTVFSSTPLRVGAAVALAVSLTGCLDSARRGPAQGASPTVALGEDVRDGAFEFTVTRVELAASQIGLHRPEGVFVVIDITAKNVGEDLRTVYCQDQQMKDLAGRTYDNAVTVGAGEDMINVKPGGRVAFTCAFDVPRGALTAAVLVHDSTYSPGATVTVLSQR